MPRRNAGSATRRCCRAPDLRPSRGEILVCSRRRSAAAMSCRGAMQDLCDATSVPAPDLRASRRDTPVCSRRNSVAAVFCRGAMQYPCDATSVSRCGAASIAWREFCLQRQAFCGSRALCRRKERPVPRDVGVALQTAPRPHDGKHSRRRNSEPAAAARRKPDLPQVLI